MKTEVLSIETADQFQQARDRAVELLKEGKLVALPTETVYGLAANALNATAVGGIYSVKGRPSHNPIIVHVSSLSMARQCAADWPERAELLARHFWPGPLTLVLPRSGLVPPIVSAGGSTVGIRFPLHPFIRQVIEHSDFPLAAPSANLANQVSPTTAEHVLESMEGRIPLVIDAGPTSVGIESTVLDLSAGTPAVLRPGMISANQIASVLGMDVNRVPSVNGPELRSPGLLQKHYSPRARLVIRRWTDDTELAAMAEESGVALNAIHVIAHERIPQVNPFGRVAIIPHDAEAYGRAIYAELHLSDELGADLIMVEALPAAEEWDGIRDRLTRASA